MPYAIHWTWHLGEQQRLLLPGISPMATFYCFIGYKLCPRFLVLLHSPQHHGSHFPLCQVGASLIVVCRAGDDFILPAFFSNQLEYDLFLFLKTRACYVAQADFKLPILLPQPQYWDCSSTVLAHCASFVSFLSKGLVYKTH